MDKYNKLSKEELKRVISFYNMKSFVVNSILKTGLAVHKALPFIFVGLLSFYGYKSCAVPYEIESKDEVPGYLDSKVESIKNGTFIYSTSWRAIKNSPKFMRTEIVYRLKDEINLDDAISIVTMSEEELSKTFSIESIRTIEKTNEEDDYIYFGDMIILPDVLTDNGEKVVRTERSREDDVILLFLITTFIGGLSLRKLEEYVTKSYVYNRINDKLESFNIINGEDVRELENLYKKARSSNRTQKDANNKYKALILQKK